MSDKDFNVHVLLHVLWVYTIHVQFAIIQNKLKWI